MIRSLIIDDEQPCIERLGRLLQECCPGVTVVESCNSVSGGLEAIRRTAPDLVFLDVMIHNETGFDLLRQLPTVDFEVIFTTAFDKYAVQAFRFSAIDYLLKPIDADDLRHAVAKLEKKLSKEQLAGKLDALFHNLKSSQAVSKRIAIPSANGLSFVDVSDIIRCQSEINYTILFFKGNQKITVARTLKEFEELLTDYNFYRVHNSHLVNLAFVKSYNRGKGGFLRMSDDSEIEVASRRKEELLKRLTG